MLKYMLLTYFLIRAGNTNFSTNIFKGTVVTLYLPSLLYIFIGSLSFSGSGSETNNSGSRFRTKFQI